MNSKLERTLESLIAICAFVSVIAVVLITVFIFISGAPAVSREGLFSFLADATWSPSSGRYGTLSLLVGSLQVTFGSLIIGIPTGLACAILIAKILNKKMAKFFQSLVEILAGIPSVVYGFFGLTVIVPGIRSFAASVAPGTATSGFSVLAGAVVLAIMILPTIVSVSANAIASVPHEFEEASYALGADNRETLVKVVIPAAKSGIFSSIVLGMGRAIGETMAVLMITGNVAKIPGSIFDPAATLTGTIALEMTYAGPKHQEALFAVGMVLFVLIVILNAIAQRIVKQEEA